MPPVSMLLLTQNDLGPLDTNELILMVSFTLIMRRHVIYLASAPYTSFCLVKFGWVSLADVRLRTLAMKQNAEFWKGL